MLGHQISSGINKMCQNRGGVGWELGSSETDGDSCAKMKVSEPSAVRVFPGSRYQHAGYQPPQLDSGQS